MIARELLHEIEALPDKERRWLIDKLSEIAEKEDADWARFSAMQLARYYGPEDSIYDEE